MAEETDLRTGQRREAEPGAAREKARGEGRPPRVSVIVPSYNKPEYLPECLKSIQDQTFTEWECIVVSDGSPRVEEIRANAASVDELHSCPV